MASPLDASIVPITLTVNGRIGLTLYAPPWEDEDGEQWQGFLGDGAKIVLFPNATELAKFIASGEENDLSDHPAWGRVQRLTPDQLRPGPDDAYDLDAVYEWAGGEPDPVHVSALANSVDMVTRIADCCDDGALRRLVGNTPEYELLVSDDVSYHGKEGRREWNALGDVIAETWERAMARVERWLDWRGDFSDTELEAETGWDRRRADPAHVARRDISHRSGRSRDQQRRAGRARGAVPRFRRHDRGVRRCRRPGAVLPHGRGARTDASGVVVGACRRAGRRGLHSGTRRELRPQNGDRARRRTAP